jgi:hypothetical protein
MRATPTLSEGVPIEATQADATPSAAARHRCASSQHLALRLSRTSRWRPRAAATKGLRCIEVLSSSSVRPPNSPSNGEVEGPHRSAQWRRGRTISQRPRRQPRSASRTPPTIVRRHHTKYHRGFPFGSMRSPHNAHSPRRCRSSAAPRSEYGAPGQHRRILGPPTT